MASNATAPKLILDNRVNVSDSFDQLINYSGVNVNVFEINPDGNSPYVSQVLYNNIVVPNISSTLVSRNIRHRYDCTISYDRTLPNKPIFAGVNDSGAGSVSYITNTVQPVDTVLRAPFPLQSVCDSVSLTINSGTNTLNSRQILDPISRRLDKKYLMYQQSECPTQLDNLVKLATDSGLFYGSAPLPIAQLADWPAVVAGGVITVGVGIQDVYYYPANLTAPVVGTVLQLVAPVGYTALCVVQNAYQNNVALANLGTIYLYQQSGTVSNQPLSKYENSAGFSRASFLPTDVSVAGNIVSVNFNVVEQVCISPLTLWDSETFLANINTLSLLFNYSSLKDIIYCGNPGAVTNIQAQSLGGIVISNAKLLLTYIQCNPEVMTIPRAVSYNYENVVYFAKTLNVTSTPGATFQCQSDTVRFQCMPSMIYLFLRSPVSQRTASETQTFFQIGQGTQNTASAGLSINIGNRTGLLASASPQTLFRISRSNGYNGDFDEWQQSGGVIMLNPVKDLGIDPSLDTLPLETGSVNFQYSCFFNNTNFNYSGVGVSPSQPELMIVSIYAGIATITTDQCMFSLGSLSGNEINAVLSNSGKSGSMLSSENVMPTVQGQGLFAKGKHILGKMASSNRSPMKM